MLIRLLHRNKITFFIIVFGLLSLNAHCQVEEHKVKSSFILNFIKYTEWPTNEKNIYQITVLGKTKVGDELERISVRKKIKGKTIKVKRIDSINKIKQPHILFIPNIEKRKIDDIVSETKNKPILIVSETAGAAKNGTHINFFITRSNKIRFEINITSLKKSGLKMSSLLIGIATEIR